MAAATCPSCGSESIQAVAISRRSAVTALLTEELTGSTAAGVAASSRSAIEAICLACGARWVPGSQREQEMRALSGQLGADVASETRARIAAREELLRQDKKRALRGILIIIAVLVGLALLAQAAGLNQ